MIPSTRYKLEDAYCLLHELKQQATEINSEYSTSNKKINEQYFSNQISTEVFVKAKEQILKQFLKDHEQIQEDMEKVGNLELEVDCVYSSYVNFDSARYSHIEKDQFDKVAVNHNSHNSIVRCIEEIEQKDHFLEISESDPTQGTHLQQEPLPPLTYITVKHNAGYGNFLSICGTGPNMTWDQEKAVRLRCQGNDLWIYETSDAFEAFQFKLLLNNKTWEKGPNHSVSKNNPIELSPLFSS